MNTKYKAVIFDLGGVLYDIEPARCERAFAALGLENFHELYSLQAQSSLFDNLETGIIGQEEFADRICTLSGKNLPKEAIYNAWNALLVGMPADILNMLRLLRKEHKIYLLSNTNIMHYNAIDIFMAQNFGISDFWSLFEKAWLSFEIGLRKPNRDIYEFILKDGGLLPEECLFIDDNKENVLGARASGITTVHKTADISTFDILRQYEILVP